MAEIKNTFLKSKMNKDLDDRLIPNGEYRDAQNISVGKSEDADVGALENIIGNANVTPSSPYGDGFEIIGYYSDPVNDRIVTFVTNYTDPYTDGQPTYVSDANNSSPAPNPLYNCHICVFDQKTNDYSSVVSGEFLNFSTTDSVLGVSLIEELLFFTDNRNQPRKINLKTAISIADYYHSEHTISVAKYNPYQPISLVKKAKHKVVTGTNNTNNLLIGGPYDDIEVGMTVTAVSVSTGTPINGLRPTDFVTVSSVSTTSPYTISTTSQSGTPNFTVSAGDSVTFLKSTMTNEEDNAQWPGDPDLIEDKYIRFSYRFQFDDGEYSIMAPFTQIAYTPKQKGYFFQGDEDAAYRSTIVDFMENEINNVELLISLPTKGSLISEEYKIKNIDILYKESDSIVVKVLETVPASQVSNLSSSTNIYTYNYQSRKPYKTLTQFETTRVFDKVPVRALSQETSGNRVMYANFYDQHTPPANIDYRVGVFDKDGINDDSYIEYPNHTAKQNRNYQIGFVLADKFGRQSSVILSPVEEFASGAFKGGSTIYHPYYSSSDQPNIQQWFGDQIQVQVNQSIQSGTNQNKPNITTGEPGLYAVPQKESSTGDGFAVDTASLSSDKLTYTFTLNSSYNVNTNVPRIGDSLRGEYKDYVKVTSVDLTAGVYTVIADGEINSNYEANTLNDPDLKFSYVINQIGWYSYKIVVKQTEQEYYNCYLPGFLNGYPAHSGTSPYPTGEAGKTAHTVLLNDNINKIPRDLSEVGPDQKQYRSSVQLFGRVQNQYDIANTPNTFNAQYFPSRYTDTVSTIATASDLNMNYDEVQSVQNFYQLDTNPLIARISTMSQPIGVAQDDMQAFLSIYETEPVASLLDIFWESSTAGLISDLNEDILTGFVGAIDITNPNFSYFENQDPLGSGEGTGSSDSPYVTGWFFPLTVEGEELDNTGLLSSEVDNVPGGYQGPITSIINANGLAVDNEFLVEQNTTAGDVNYGAYRFKLSSVLAAYNAYTSDALSREFTFNISVLNDSGDWSGNFSFNGSLQNNDPYLYDSFNNPKAAELDVITINSPVSGDNPKNIGLPDLPGTQNNQMSNGSRYAAGVNIKQGVGTYLSSIPKKPYQYMNQIYVDHTSGTLGFSYYINGNPGVNGGYQVGEYEIELKLKDAMVDTGNSGWQTVSDQGTESSGTLESITYNQKIKVLPDTIPEDLVTTCLTTNVNDSRQGDTGSVGTNVYWQWFVGDSSSVTRPSDAYQGVLGTQSSGPSPARLGSTGFNASETSGTMLLDLMLESEYVSGGTVSGIVCEWNIWTRSSSSGTWSMTTIKDTNNLNINTSGIRGNGSTIQVASNSSIYPKSSINIPVAYDVKGEYFIQARLNRTDQHNTGTCWVNVSDANYPSCVPLFGDNMINPLLPGDNRDSEFFAYEYSTSDEDASCSSTIDSGLVYGRTPYSHVLTQLFTDTSLSTNPSESPAKRLYKYVPQGLPTDPKNTLVINRTAEFENMNQVSTNTTNDVDANGYKTNLFYIDTPSIISFVPTPWREGCGGAYNTSTASYLFENYL
jgi:hypothetical protein